MVAVVYHFPKYRTIEMEAINTFIFEMFSFSWFIFQTTPTVSIFKISVFQFIESLMIHQITDHM